MTLILSVLACPPLCSKQFFRFLNHLFLACQRESNPVPVVPFERHIVLAIALGIVAVFLFFHGEIIFYFFRLDRGIH